LRSSEGKEKGFEITIRKVGPVTDFLFQQNPRAGFEVPMLGIGGEFEIKQEESVTPFVAGGVGITPLLGHLGKLDLGSGRFKLLWAVRVGDADFVVDTLKQYPELAKATEVFVTGSAEDEREAVRRKMTTLGAKVHTRRLAKSDLDSVIAGKWYLCAGKPFRKQVLSLLEGKEVVFEDFDY
jgi:ferredoxin-NADP reductase